MEQPDQTVSENSKDEPEKKFYDVLTAKKDNYTVTVSYGSKAGIPKNSSLRVSEITSNADDYSTYVEKAADAVHADKSDVTYGRFFDISIIDSDGNVIEPKKHVDVKISLKDGQDLTNAESANVVHFADDGTQVISNTAKEHDDVLQNVSFQAESFSVYGVIVVSRDSATYTMNAIPVEKTSDGKLKENGKAINISLTGNIKASDHISLDSPDFKIGDAPIGELTGKLFHTADPDTEANKEDIFENATEVSYLIATEDESQNKYLRAYDTAGNLLSGGSLLYVGSAEEVHDVTLNATSIQTIEKVPLTDNAQKTLVLYNYISDHDSYSANVRGAEGQKFDLNDLFAASDFYYEKNAQNPEKKDKRDGTVLQKCTKAQIVKNANDQYKLEPLDVNGQPVQDASIYMVYDKEYEFTVIANSVVNEHSEDDGNAIFWKGKKYQRYRDAPNGNARWNNNVDLSNPDSTNVVPRELTFTGHIGDQFTPNDLGHDGIVYAGIDGDTTPVRTYTKGNGTPQISYYSQNSWSGGEYWEILGRDNGNKITASDYTPNGGSGARYDCYRFDDYTVLNKYHDRINYFEIVDDGNGNPAIRAMHQDTSKTSGDANGNSYILNHQKTKSVTNADNGQSDEFVTYRDPGDNNIGQGGNLILYIARDSVVHQSAFDQRTPDHIQLRFSNTFQTVINGKNYSGQFSLDRNNPGSVTISYNNQSINGQFGYENDQETGQIGISDLNISLDDRFDSSKVHATVTYRLVGTLTNLNDSTDVIKYDENNPYVFTMTLGNNQLHEAYYACPNQKGYDVVLDLTEAIKSSNTTDQIRVTKIWNDDNDREHYRPRKVTVTLQRSKDGVNWEDFGKDRDGKIIPYTVDITGDRTNNIWGKTIGGLDKYQDAKGEYQPYQYKIVDGSETFDTNIPNDIYRKEIINDLTITNTSVMPEITISGHKEWKDADGNNLSNDLIPENITVGIYQLRENESSNNITSDNIGTNTGKFFKSQTIGKADSWEFSFTGLPKYYWDGTSFKQYSYVVAEYRSNSTPYDEYFEPSVVLDKADSNGNYENVTITNTYRPQIRIRKINDDHKNVIGLNGAVFQLYTDETCNTLATTIDNKAIGNSKNELITGTDGYVVIGQLKEGTYYLKETKAPSGYMASESPIRFKVDSTGKVTYSSEGEKASEDKNTTGNTVYYTIPVENHAGSELPSTGGNGTHAFTILGLLLLASAGALFTLKKKSIL